MRIICIKIIISKFAEFLNQKDNYYKNERKQT